MIVALANLGFQPFKENCYHDPLLLVAEMYDSTAIVTLSKLQFGSISSMMVIAERVQVPDLESQASQGPISLQHTTLNSFRCFSKEIVPHQSPSLFPVLATVATNLRICTQVLYVVGWQASCIARCLPPDYVSVFTIFIFVAFFLCLLNF